MIQPRYETIKNHLLEKIERGELSPGTKVASENQLSEQFSVSRMTARRALDELSDAGFLFRSQGLGTFVSDSRPMSSMLEIRNIADEIRERGHQCTIEVLKLEAIEASEQHAIWFDLPVGKKIFHSTLVYFENNQAVQYEDRLVNPILVPAYLDQDFSSTTPNEYLSKIAPLTEANHIVEAILASSETQHQIASYMKLSGSSPCLKITRRTFSRKGVVSVATLFHPGDRYRLGGHLQISKSS